MSNLRALTPKVLNITVTIQRINDRQVKVAIETPPEVKLPTQLVHD
jgi:sRNA-binding carbon storage regulator CsrA